MTTHRVRPSAHLRPLTDGILGVCAPAALLVSLATLTVIGQAAPSFSVDDVTANEGHSGQSWVEFTVSVANSNGTESSVGFTTNDGTANGGQLTATFPSAGPIVLGDGPSSPYGVPITVTGVTGRLTSISMLFDGLGHPSPPDLDVLVVAPGGQAMVVQSDTGPATNPSIPSYILRDFSPLIFPASVNLLLGGVYGPTSRSPADVFPAPAPPGPHGEAPPAGTATLTDTFGGTDPNGTWRVFINDDAAGGTGSLNRIVLTVGTPEPGTDYNDVFGRVTFPPGVTTQRIRVAINGDATLEPDETLFLDLGVPVNGVIGDGRGIATIRNDDGGSTGSPPTAVNDKYVGIGGGIARTSADGLLSNDLPNGGGPMTAVLVEGPKTGVLTLNADGGFAYLPGALYFRETFTYRAVNAFGESLTAVVTLVDSNTELNIGPGNFRVVSIGEPLVDLVGNLRRQVTVRFDRLDQALIPTEFGLAGGVQPGQTQVFVPTGSAFPIFTFAAPSGSFFARMHALLGISQSGPSNEVPLHVNTTVPPSAPANLLSAVDGSNLTFAWKNTFLGGIPTSSFLQVTGDATATLPLGQGETISFANVPAGTYRVSVLNGNAGGVSAASNAVTVTSPGPCSPPQMPEDFLLYVEGRILGAIWDLPANGPAPDGYRLHVTSTIFTGTVPVKTTTIRAPVAPGAYTVSLDATTACGASARTPTQTVVVP